MDFESHRLLLQAMAVYTSVLYFLEYLSQFLFDRSYCFGYFSVFLNFITSINNLDTSCEEITNGLRISMLTIHWTSRVRCVFIR